MPRPAVRAVQRERGYWAHARRTDDRARPRRAQFAQTVGDSCLNCTGRTGTAACPVTDPLKVEFQRKLDLTLIILKIASGRDLAKGRRRSVIECAGSGCNSVAAEAGRRKVGMVRQVEEFRAKL